MPIYEYKCSNDHVTDKLVRHSDVVETITCPECGEEANRAIVSAPSFELKGTWFKTKGSY